MSTSPSPTSSLPRIYIVADPGPWSPDVVGYALAEDGSLLATHVSSSGSWCKHDMTTEAKHAAYRAAYPDGYEVEWVPWDEREGHEGYMAARERNRALAGEEATHARSPRR